jgi:hypothetical protein
MSSSYYKAVNTRFCVVLILAFAAMMTAYGAADLLRWWLTGEVGESTISLGFLLWLLAAGLWWAGRKKSEGFPG